MSCPAWETVSFLCLTSLRQQFPWSLRSCLPWDKIDCSSQCPGICVITVLICYIKPLFYGFMGNSQTVSWRRVETLGNYCRRLRVTVFPQFFPLLKKQQFDLSLRSHGISVLLSNLLSCLFKIYQKNYRNRRF